MANLNLNTVKNKPFPERMSIARTAMTEPQKIKYRKAVEYTPFEMSIIQQNAGRPMFESYEDYFLDEDLY